MLHTCVQGKNSLLISVKHEAVPFQKQFIALISPPWEYTNLQIRIPLGGSISIYYINFEAKKAACPTKNLLRRRKILISNLQLLSRPSLIQYISSAPSLQINK